MEKASKNFISNLKKQKREDKSLLFLDNVKIIRDAVANGTVKVFCMLTTLGEEDFEKLGLGFEKQQNEKFEILKIDQSTLQQLANTKTPQKVLCIAYHTQHVVVAPKTNFLVLDGLQDPGNVGTLIRTAKAAGFESVFLLDSVNATNPKLVRSSVGAVLNENVFEMSREMFADFAKTHKLQLVCCDMDGENIFSFQPKGSVGVVIGNEGQGVSNQIRTLCAKTVKIPMCSGIESLNAAVSGAIVMYQINKNKFC